MYRELSAADYFNTEDAQVRSGNATGCGHTCPGCHTGLPCIRMTHGDDKPHVGRDADGQLVQWIGPCDAATHATATELQAAAVQEETNARAQRTRDFLTGLDPDILRDFLDGAAR